MDRQPSADALIAYMSGQGKDIEVWVNREEALRRIAAELDALGYNHLSGTIHDAARLARGAVESKERRRNGSQAFKAGRSSRDNPYPPGTEERYDNMGCTVFDH